MVSGIFFTIAVIKYNVTKFREEKINPFSSVKLNKGFDIIVKYLIPVEFAVMLVWWLYQSFGYTGGDNFNIFGVYSLGTTLFQWAVILIVFIMFNKKIVKLLKNNEES